MESVIKKIVIIGSGNVATRLAMEFNRIGLEIVQIAGRTKNNTKELANKLKVPFTTSFDEITKNADLYVLSISDDALFNFKFSVGDKLVVHTSGTTPMSVLNGYSNYGVFYPLQTFSKEKSVSFDNVPICLEASSEKSLEILKDLASLLSKNIMEVNSEQRRILHVGAVFVNNFTNHLYHIADEILKDFDLPFEILKPLIEETVTKLKNHKPDEVQTGPAKRNDQKIIQNHLSILDDYPEYQKIYRLLSEQIKNKYHKDE